MYYISVGLNKAAGTTVGAVFGLTINGVASPSAPIACSDTGGLSLVIRVQNYNAGDTIQITNFSTFPVVLANAPNQANSAGHVTIHRYASGPSGTLITI
ncbi:hypothetical protein JCM19047_4592 [Bacillus sp. JCM 19047]|nr:hypothetical protein JCM19047_4592 [Bacillus sp. JCM 19047]